MTVPINKSLSPCYFVRAFVRSKKKICITYVVLLGFYLVGIPVCRAEACLAIGEADIIIVSKFVLGIF